MKTVTALAMASLALMPAAAFGADKASQSSGLPTCAQLADLIKGNENVNEQQGSLQGDRAKNDRKVLSVTTELIPAERGPTVHPSGNHTGVIHPGYCKVTITQAPSIQIGIGLPLSDVDGGYGEAQGAWNGRIHALGGGGTNGGKLYPTTSATDFGYVGTSSQPGIGKDWCNAINPKTGKPNAVKDCGLGGGGWLLGPDNQPNWDIYSIYIEDAALAQTLWGMEATRLYYGQEPKYKYFSSCQHGGGRLGLYLAQRHPQFYDGVLTGPDAYNQSRFIQALQWPQIMAYTLPGHILAPEKSAAATAAAIKACESDYGVGLGIIGEPRRCKFDAKALICKGNKADPATCLTSQEAAVINSIWDGPRNAKGERIWGGLPKGSSFDTSLPKGGASFIYLITSWSIYATRQDPNFDPRQLTPQNFEAEFEKSYYTWSNPTKNWGIDSVNFDKARDGGTKIIQMSSAADPLNFPFTSYNFVSRLFARYGVPESQEFFRTFYFPGNGHCGDGIGPEMDTRVMFEELRNWVEKGKAPDSVVATGKLKDERTISRPICKYPDEAVYNGSGSMLMAKNFHCVVNTKEPADLAAYARSTHDSPETDAKLQSQPVRP